MVLLGNKRYAKLDRYLHHFNTRARFKRTTLRTQETQANNVFLLLRCKTLHDRSFFCILEEGKENERETHRFHGNHRRGRKQRREND